MDEIKRTELVRSMRPNEALSKPFTMEELESAIKKLKRNVAPGPDMIPNSFLKLLGTTAKEAPCCC